MSVPSFRCVWKDLTFKSFDLSVLVSQCHSERQEPYTSKELSLYYVHGNYISSQLLSSRETAKYAVLTVTVFEYARTLPSHLPLSRSLWPSSRPEAHLKIVLSYEPCAVSLPRPLWVTNGNLHDCVSKVRKVVSRRPTSNLIKNVGTSL